MNEFDIGSRRVGTGRPAFVIAEMAWSHDGDLEKARRIVRGAAEAGCDAVQFHLTSLPDYMVRRYGAGAGRVSAGHEDEASVYRYLERINLSLDDFGTLFAEAARLGLAAGALANDGASLEFAISRAPAYLAISPSCMADRAFLRAAGSAGLPVSLRTGGATVGEIEEAVETLRAAGCDRILLLHGFQSYPTDPEEVHLRFLATLARLFDLPVGYADHVDAEGPLAFVAPLLGLAAGANAIEKHLTYDRRLRGEDWESALDPVEMKRFVALLRQAEAMFGSASWRPLSEAERRYRDVARKRAVARRPLAPGDVLTPDAVAFKRADEGVDVRAVEAYLGLRVGRALGPDDGITRGAFE